MGMAACRAGGLPPSRLAAGAGCQIHTIPLCFMKSKEIRLRRMATSDSIFLDSQISIKPNVGIMGMAARPAGGLPPGRLAAAAGCHFHTNPLGLTKTKAISLKRVEPSDSILMDLRIPTNPKVAVWGGAGGLANWRYPKGSQADPEGAQR